MKVFFVMITIEILQPLYAQPKDSLRSYPGIPAGTTKPEIFSSGFIDVVNNGQINASARFIRLQIGEPGKFSFPLSLYSGVSNNSFQAQGLSTGGRKNEHLVSQYINPLSGLINLSVEDILFFKTNTSRVTQSGLLYHGGGRVLTGYAPGTGLRPINFVNGFCSAGLYFQTGAWERSNSKNMGVFWLAARYIFCKSGSGQLGQLLPDIQTNGLYHGWSAAWGVEINNLLNFKVVYYKYIKRPETACSTPVYQFSFQYTMR